MTAADRMAFAEAMAALALALGEECSQQRAELYFAALTDLPLEAVRRAVGEAIRTCRFFPRPAELRTLGGVALVLPDAEAVHEALRQAKRTPGAFFHQPPMTPLLQAVVQRLGGWQAVMDLSETDMHFRLRAMVGPLVKEDAARRESLALAPGVERRQIEEQSRA